ncbi:transposase family protein [Streptomyces mirabilis]|uniref:transposase family protein n=1 Tax=Streptomyces mirabilis TaxID=68239 RepID=UPI0033EF2809
MSNVRCLGSLLALCMVAVLGGATSLAAIARFAADTDSHLREQLGLTSSTPNASTLGRFLARLDGDAVGAWLARYAADEPGDTLVCLAVDGQTVRGPRTDGAAVHLPAAALHACQTVIAQRQIAANAGDSRSQCRHQHHRRGDRQLPAGPASVSRADPGHVQDLSGRSRTHAGCGMHSCDLSSATRLDAAGLSHPPAML